MFLYPDNALHIPPEKIGYKPREVDIPSTDGIRLHAWHFPCSPCENHKGTILQFHGNAENMTSHYVSLVWLTRYGYDLWTFDYRGYGRSGGKPDVSGSVNDGLAALKFIEQMSKAGLSPKLIVYGQSLGGAIAMKALEEFNQPDKISLLVLDSTFDSYQRIARMKLSEHVLTWPFSPLASLLVSDQASPEKTLGQLTMPKIVIHDQKDPVVEYANGKSLFKALPQPKEMWELNKGRHVGVFALDTIENRKMFLEKLDRIPAPVLRPAAHSMAAKAH